MDYELLNVAWVTAAVVAITGATMMALALTCKVLQRCYLRCRRQRTQLQRRQQQTVISNAATASASVAATAASGTAAVPNNDSFDTFLQLSFNSQQATPVAAADNGPSRSPRGRSVAALRSPDEAGGRYKKASTGLSAMQKQPQNLLDFGRSMTFEIRASEDSEDDVEADADSCDEAKHTQLSASGRQAETARTSGRTASGQSAAGGASGVPTGFYDPGGYDMEWPPTSSGRPAAHAGAGESWHSRHHQQQQQQQQQQGRRGHIFFGRGAHHGSGRYAGNL